MKVMVMKMSNVSFPGLSLSFTLNSTAFTVMGRDIKWYAIIILTGIILAVVFGIWEGKRTGVSSETILDIVLICVPTAIVCARLYYVVFEWDYYGRHIDEILQIWNGGLAIYGGVIGGCVAGYIYCRIKKISMGELFDIGGFGFLIGQTLGRWGNFMNAEAYGYETDLPWRMYVEDIGMAVHPTFLYESLWNFIGFLILFFYRRHKNFGGEIFFMYIVWYGVGRTLIEGLRSDSLYIASTGIRTSQLVAVIMVVTGLAVICINRYRLHNKK